VFELRAPHNKAHASPLSKRKFECGSNSYSCESIGAPSYCCRVDEDCIKVGDKENIGCCRKGQKCQGPIKGCRADQVQCDPAQGSGCCPKGFKCSLSGCVPGNSSEGTQTTSVGGNQTTEACSSGYHACPSTLAGGCCNDGLPSSYHRAGNEHRGRWL